MKFCVFCSLLLVFPNEINLSFKKSSVIFSYLFNLVLFKGFILLDNEFLLNFVSDKLISFFALASPSSFFSLFSFSPSFSSFSELIP